MVRVQFWWIEGGSFTCINRVTSLGAYGFPSLLPVLVHHNSYSFLPNSLIWQFNPLAMFSWTRLRFKLAGPRSAVGSASDSRDRGPGFDIWSGHILSFLLPLIQEKHPSQLLAKVCARNNRTGLGGISLPWKSVST